MTIATDEFPSRSPEAVATTAEWENLVEQLTECGQTDERLRLVVLFGSVVSGRANRLSDVDLAVMESQPLSADRKMELIERFALVANRPVDLVDLRTAHGPLRREVLTHGRKLLCRDVGLYADLLRRMLFDDADFQPLIRALHARRLQQWIGT